MWKRFFFALFLLLAKFVEGISVGHNHDVYKDLCEISRAASSALQGRGAGEMKKKLEEAIYGIVGRARFDENGNLQIGRKCASGFNGRGIFCKYSSMDRGWNMGDGCYAESLVGAFMCLCAPGSEQSRVDNLCGVDVRGYTNDAWYGSFSTQEDVSTLFQNVWKHAIKKCIEGKEHVNSEAEELQNLEKAVKEVRRKIERKKGGSNFYFLGESGSCDGRSGRDVCAAYQKKGSKVEIPWAKKIEAAVDELKKIIKQQAETPTLLNSAPSPQGSRGQSVAPMEDAGSTQSATQSETTQQESNMKHENGEYETETHKSIAKSEKIQISRTKRSPPLTSLTDVPHLATDPDDDGSNIIESQWPFLAALLI
ncbi:Variant surface glycoprotein [Trypanosoma congolense IL3000]|uniref:Variant surface glycoprotein n=1 Tax=Trypanosoma congolense (strain IL3000) TaxID=1068625 RepID=F9WFV8_TRYCI|nr:Variant surface glycoprotein [Trypanosoma congolense IL3000]